MHRGWAVLGGYPVLQILGYDSARRPSRVLAVAITAHYDSRMHGWRPPALR